MSTVVQPSDKPTSASKPTETEIIALSPRILITLAAAIEFIAFFLPWANILGMNLSGLDIQKNFPSYRLVWLLPALAAITCFLNIAGLKTGLLRRLAGLAPAIILAYGLSQLGSDLLKSISWCGWLAFAAGVALICIPSGFKPAAKA